MQGSLLLAGWEGGRVVPLPSFQLPLILPFFSGLHLKCLWLSYILLVNSPRKLSLGTILEILPRGRYQKAGPEVAVSSFSHTIRAIFLNLTLVKKGTHRPLVMNSSVCLSIFHFSLPSPPSAQSSSGNTERGICDSNSKSNSLLLLEVLSSKYLR